MPDKELALLKKIAGNFQRHPDQLNKLCEADAEIIRFPKQAPEYLVFKTDGIHEEIREKLYEDPWLIGWMAVTVTISDLAAVGAEPFGILLTLQLPAEVEDSWLKLFQHGINEACTTYQVQVLGGDTNFGMDTTVSTTGIGTMAQTKPMLRKQMVPGDLLYASGKLGVGNAFAYARYFDGSIQVAYKPTARLRESKLIRNFATACIDTSDGLFPALSVLSELNEAGFQFDRPLPEYLCCSTKAVQAAAGIPAWMLLAGPHGEYELLFSIPAASQAAFEAACQTQQFEPVLLGKVIPQQQLVFVSEEATVTCEPSEIANLFSEAGGNIQLYYQMLQEKHKQWVASGTALYAH